MNQVSSPSATKTTMYPIRQKVYELATRMMARTTLVEGVLKGSGLPFRCLFVHSCLFTAELSKRTFATTPKVIRQSRIFIPMLGQHLKAHAGEFDLCAAVLPSFYESMFGARCSYKGQEEVRQVIDTDQDWESLRQNFSRKKRQVTNDFAEKNGLSFKISHATEDFDFFYHRMHVPHIRRRYGELADLDSYDTMKSFFEKGYVLFVTKNDQPVAGALSVIEGDTMMFRRSGVLDGDESHVKAGAQTALYYFQLRYAVENGIKAVDTMKTAPFLNDGVFKHKADWGAKTLRDDETTRSVYYFTNGPTEQLAAFFEQNPLAICVGDGLAGLVGYRAPQGMPQNGLPALTQQLLVSGLDSLVPVIWPEQVGLPQPLAQTSARPA
jgi:hypothetical protein